MNIGGHPPIPLVQRIVFHFVNFLQFFGSQTSQIYLSDEVSNTPSGDCMKNLCPQEFDVSTTPIGARKPFGVSSSRVMVLIFFMLKMPLEPHCNRHLLANERSRHISSQR
jgi:hypothetical protein